MMQLTLSGQITVRMLAQKMKCLIDSEPWTTWLRPSRWLREYDPSTNMRARWHSHLQVVFETVDFM